MYLYIIYCINNALATVLCPQHWFEVIGFTGDLTTVFTIDLRPLCACLTLEQIVSTLVYTIHANVVGVALGINAVDLLVLVFQLRAHIQCHVP